MNYNFFLLFLLITPYLTETKMPCSQIATHKQNFDATFKKFKKNKKSITPKKAVSRHAVYTPKTYNNRNLCTPINTAPHRAYKPSLNLILKVLNKTLDIVDDPYFRLFAVVGLIVYARNKE